MTDLERSHVELRAALRVIAAHGARVTMKLSYSCLMGLIQFTAQIGPEFFDHIGQGVIADLRPPHAGGVGQGGSPLG
jgi:hypothetical protein